MAETNNHWFADYKDYWIGIGIFNVLQGVIIYFTRESNYTPVVDLLITILLGFAVNAFVSLLIFMIIGLFKRTFPTIRFIKTFARWSFIYLLIIIIDAFML
ncbi:MAG: hypothetical protein ACNS60_13655 [Candidatus Cyclobacteriaceae bacterium M2_1C_046]